MGLFDTTNGHTGQDNQYPVSKTAYQQNVSKPVNTNWFSGSIPTAYELRGKILNLMKEDPEEAMKAATVFSQLQDTPTSPYYSKYQHPNTEDQSPETTLLTQQALKECGALKEEIGYVTGRSDRNYSDDQVISTVYGEDGKAFSQKYPTLARMDRGEDLSFNEPVPYSGDWVRGNIWAARNNGGTGLDEADIASAASGAGNQWQENPDISAKLNANDPNTYAPYDVGMTLDNEGLYFGVYAFGNEEIERLKAGLDPRTGAPLDQSDATAMQMRNNVLAAEQTTESAEKEKASLDAMIAEWVKNGYSPAVVMRKADEYLRNNCPTLTEMDKSLESLDLLPTTRAVNYRHADLENAVVAGCAERAKKKNGFQIASSSVSDVGFGTKTDADIADAKAKDQKSADISAAMSGATTEDEKTVWQNAGSVTWNDTVNFFNGVKNLGTQLFRNIAETNGKTVTNNYFKSMSGVMETVGTYNYVSERNNENKKRYEELQKVYGDIKYLNQEVEPQKSFFVGDINVTMEYMPGDSDAGIAPGYVITNMYSDERHINFTDDYDDFSMLSQKDQQLIAEAENIAKHESVEAIKTEKAHKFLDMFGKKGEKDLEEYKALHGQIQLDDQYLTDNKGNYNAANADLTRSSNALYLTQTAMNWLGADTTMIRDAEAMLEYMSQFYYEPQLNNSPESKLQTLQRIYNEAGKPLTTKHGSELLHDAEAKIDEEIAKIDAFAQYAEANGLELPDKVKRNMTFMRQDYENEKRSIQYSEILTDVKQDEIDKAVDAALAFEKKYGEGNMNYWVNLFPNADMLRTITANPRYKENYNENVLPYEDIQTYYYLLGKKVLEMGDSLDEAIAKIGTDPEATEAALREVFSEAGAYEKFMEDGDSGYGLWAIREFDQSAEYGKELVESGTAGGIQANLMATVVTPADAVASALEILDTAITGKRFNTKSFARRSGAFKDATRAETRKSIEEAYGKDTLGSKLAMLGYEIYCNRGDSFMNSITFGSMFHIGGAAGALLNEFIGASPMGASAALSAAAKAVEDGANTDQAWLILGTTFLAETMTEAITLSNIKEAFNFAEGLTSESLKSIVVDWLTRSGVEEMFGETANDLFENYFGQKAADWFNNPEYKSEHEQLVQKYLGDGYLMEDAEAAAYEEEIKGMLHTALVSYISAGTNVLVSTGKAASNSFNLYRYTAKSYQKIGFGNVSTLGLMMNDLRSRNSVTEPYIGIQIDTDEAKQSAAKDVITLEQAKEGDPSAQNAAMAAVLESGLGENNDRGEAAAASVTKVFGENAAEQIQTILTGAANGGVNLALVKVALQNAALGMGKATELINTDEFKTASPEEKARMLLDTVGEDNKNQTVQDNIFAAVKDFRSTRVIASELAPNGHFDQALADQEAAETARKNTAEAQDELDRKNSEVESAAEANAAAVQEMVQNPTDDNEKAVRDTATDVRQRDEVAHQAEQHLAKEQVLQDKAESKAKKSTEDAMTSAREIADQRIAEEDQQRAEISAQKEEQRRLAEEEKARAQAEEDERSGKADEDRTRDFAERWAKARGLEGEEYDAFIERVMNRREQQKLGTIDMNGKMSNTEGYLAISAFARKTGLTFMLTDKLPNNTRGMYSDGVVYLNQNLVNNGTMTVGQALVEAALHEVPHAMENTKNYKTYRNVVLSFLFETDGSKTTQELYENNPDFRAAVDDKINKYKSGVDQDLSLEDAEKEIVADFAREFLADKEVVQRFMDAGMGGKMRNTLHNINQGLKNFYAQLKGEDRTQAEYLRKAERAYQKAMDELAKTAIHPEGGQFSVAQIAQATGLQFDEETLELYDVDEDGNRIVITEVTPEMIDNTPVGMLIDNGLSDESPGVDENGNPIDSQKVAAKKMMAGLMSLVAKYRNSNLIWEIGAATLSSTFSAIKSNSDPQYKTTVDFGTVCAKTQAIIDVMSQVMLDKIDQTTGMIKEGMKAGLTRQDIMTVYDKVNEAKLSVPCPVCYVFSRWMGVPSLLGQMSTYQHNYVATTKDENGNTVIDKEATQANVDAYLKEVEKNGDAKAINNKKTKLQGQRNKLEQKRVDLEGQLYDKTLTAEEKDSIRSQIKDVIGQMVELDDQIGELSAYNWVTQALCKKEGDRYVVDDAFQLTPDEILFDLNRTGEFAGYAKNWRYRNTRGAGMGKAIMPYSGETIGDVLYGVKAKGRQSRTSNPWLKMDPKAAGRQLQSARDRAKKQNLIGGQRLQSTSDFRPEWGLDYIMSFLELQAAGSKVQMYTKVAEAVDFFASVGADVNLSIMGEGQGWHIDENGDYVLDFSKITGMDYDTAKALKDKYNNVQMILVGMNDTHIRLALANDDIDFVIPWHSSGNSKETLAGLIKAVGEKLDSSVDYTTTQTDMVKGTKKSYTDENGNKVEYTAPGEQTQEQKDLWDARMTLLTKGDKALTQEQRKALLSNPYTKELYRRFTEKGVDPDCYGVKLNKDQAAQIFPYEYWDTSLTKDQADENGKRFVEYCEAMGIVPRFSQFKDDPGYWKLLIDRPMYDNEGNYRSQQVIDVTKARIGNLNDEGQLENSDLPMAAQAKYASKDPRSENYYEYKTREIEAIDNAEAELGMQYDVEEVGDDNVFTDTEETDDTGEAVPDGQFSMDGEITDADIDQQLAQAGLIGEDLSVPETLPGIPENLPGMPLEGEQKQRQFGSKTAQESDALHEEVKDYLFNNSSYTPDTNQEQVNRAIDWVRSKATDNDPNGFYAAVDEVTSPDFDYASADGQARMLTVMAMAAKSGNIDIEMKIANAYNQQGTDIGRALQARKIFRLMSPLGRRQALLNEVNNINQDYANHNKDTRVELSDWTLKAAEAAETEEDFAKVQKAAERELASQMPANWKEKLRTWRMMSMLANPRTHVRNFLGNFTFMPVVGLKNAIGTGMESYFSDHSLFGQTVAEGEHTKSITHTQDAKDFAKKDAKAMRDTLTGEAKYTPEDKIQRNKKAFGQGKGVLSKTVGRFYQGLADFNSNALEWEDWVFLNHHYQSALAGYMTANGLKSEDMTGETLDKARAYATLEAQKATYRDANAISSKLNQWSRDGGVGGFLVDAVLPFKKTPANILRRGIEYSPIGLIKSFATAKRDLDLYSAWVQNGQKGKMPKGAKSATQVIDSLAAGLTGTGIAALGALGYALGAVRLGYGGDDDDELDKLRGGQEYSIELFGKTFTIDWLAPACMPFFTGASLYKEFAEAAENFDDISDATGLIGRFINSLSGITEPVFNLSMLDGVSSLLKSTSYSNGNKIPIWELLQNVGANYVSSYVPSRWGAAARIIDPVRRQSYVEPGDPLRIWKQKIEQAQNKIPFLSRSNTPARNVWGEVIEQSQAEAALENILLPGYLEDVKNDQLTEELQRVYDQTGESGVIPKKGSKSIGGVAMTDQEYDKYSETLGQTSKNLLTDMIGRDEFIALTPTDQTPGNPGAQAILIGDVYQYAREVARKEYDPSFEMTGWVKSAYASGDPVGAIFAREEAKAQKSEAELAKSDLITSINGEDTEAIGTSVEALKRAGKTDNQIKNILYEAYRDEYKEAYRNGDQETMDRIKYGMMFCDLGESTIKEEEGKTSIFKKWENAVDKENGGSSRLDGMHIASGSMSDTGMAPKIPKRPESEENWDEYMDDLDDYWARHNFDRNDPVGQYGEGNIDLNNREVVLNNDGSISTEQSFSFYDEDTGKEVLIPRVIDGRIVKDNEAIQHYYDTGEYLGMFDNWQDADEYAMMLHNRQNWYYNNR